MKVIYYSGFPFADCDFPLIREYRRRGIDVRYYLPFLPNKPHGPLVSIRAPKAKSGVYKASEYGEFAPYGDYIDLDKVFVVNRTRVGGHPRNILLYLRLAFEWLRFRPDVVHISFPIAGPEWPLYLLRRKMVLTVHDPEFHSGEGSGKMENQRKAAFKLVPKLVLLNGRQKDAFVERYHISKPILVNRLGAYETLRQFKPQPSGYGKYILHFGRISPYKGIEDLCAAMQTVGRSIPDLKCVIAGGGSLYFDFAPFADNKNIVLINRYIDTGELVSLIDGALFCVCPYRDATQSGVVSSAFAFDKPVVASDVGALGESVIDGVTGKLVPAGDVSSLASAIISLAQNPETLEMMSAAICKCRTAGDLCWEKIADGYLNFYRSNI